MTPFEMWPKWTFCIIYSRGYGPDMQCQTAPHITTCSEQKAVQQTSLLDLLSCIQTLKTDQPITSNAVFTSLKFIEL